MGNEIRTSWLVIEVLHIELAGQQKHPKVLHAKALLDLCVIYGWNVVESKVSEIESRSEFHSILLQTDFDKVLNDENYNTAVRLKYNNEINNG